MNSPGEPCGAGQRAVDPACAALVVPVKAFSMAKQRLAGSLDADARRALAKRMLKHVLSAGRPLDAFVVCDDDEVAEWAGSAGADVLWMPGVGLNAAVDGALGELARRGRTAAVIAHGDLPLAHDLAALASHDTITLVPDTRGDGTNVLSVPLPAPLSASYGPGSFARHLAAAQCSPYDVRVVRDRRLALDVDRPADLVHPLVSAALGTAHGR